MRPTKETSATWFLFSADRIFLLLEEEEWKSATLAARWIDKIFKSDRE